MDIYDKIQYIKQLPTSNVELEEALGRPINVVRYTDLKKYKNIDDLLGKNGECIILYETSPDIGHWVCCFKRGNNTISFFDSLGLMPDDQFHSICIKFRKSQGISIPYLTYLLDASNKKIEWNEYNLQDPDDSISTCGRWCVLRLRMKHLTPKKFYELFKTDNNLSSDDFVVLSY